MDFLRGLETLSQQKRELGKIRTATNYMVAYRSFAGFLRQRNGSTALPLNDVTPRLIVEYENYLLSVRGVQRNSSSAYLRIIRAAYYKLTADKRGQDSNPFAPVYTGVDRTIKRSVGIPAIRRLNELTLNKWGLRLSRDLFLFSFYARGIAFIDLAQLTQNNVQKGRLTYIRSKTRQLLSVKIENPMLTIIDRYARINAPYLFPILHSSHFNQQEYDKALRTYNNHLHHLGFLIGCPTTLSSYVARHSWATTAKRLNVATRVISESMGHTDETTTQIYLDSLDLDKLDTANRKIIHEITQRKNVRKNEQNPKARSGYALHNALNAPCYISTSTQEVENHTA